MGDSDIHRQWDAAAPGWARWEHLVAAWMKPATDAMLATARVKAGARVLDLASGAGSQALAAAALAGTAGHVVATDIAETMLQHVQDNARAAELTNVSTLLGAAEDLQLPPQCFDAVICRLGLMLFRNPDQALRVAHRALRPGGRIAAVVFTTPSANAFMAKPMQILLRHAGKQPPAPGHPGIFALGSPGILERLLAETGFDAIEQTVLPVDLRMSSAARALIMIQEAFGAYRSVLSEYPESVQKSAWAEVAESLAQFETPNGFIAPAEVLVAGGRRAGARRRAAG